MRLSTKDAVGVALVAFTGLVVLVHNNSTSPDQLQGLVEGQSDGQATVFFDFNVLPTNRDVALPHQVVVVRGAVIERIGQVGTFTLPEAARRIEGGGSAYLVPGPRNVLGAIEPGTLADLLLLERDPRDGVEVRRHPLGAMIHGRWYGRRMIDGMLAAARAP